MAQQPLSVSYEGSSGRQITVTSTGTSDAEQQVAKEREFLLAAQSRFHASVEFESSNRAEQRIDQEFFEGSGQWPQQMMAERSSDGRPSLTINRLKAFQRQIANQQRQAKPSIQVNPVDSQNDPKVAEIYQGIIRHIEQQSQADVAYDTACEHQVISGRGWIRVAVEWDPRDQWRQVIRIRRVRNPFSVYMDPAAAEHDCSDARYAFVIEDIPKDEFRQLYGEQALTEAANFSFAQHTDMSAEWMPEGKIRIAEYFYVETEKKKVTLLSTGEEVPTSELKDGSPLMEYLNVSGTTVVRTREIEIRTVKWAKITAGKILEQGTWPGRWIPLVPVTGYELNVNGRVIICGMVRDARDPQRMYNYWVSSETETIALAPKAPFVGMEGQFEGHEKKWAAANRRSFPYLEYKGKSVGGQLAPPPQRQFNEPPIQAIALATRQADNDLKAVIGLYDASLGERGPEESARAILARQRQGDMSNSHWIDNLVRSLRTLGYQLVDLIPRIYDAPQVMRILGRDDKPMNVLVHSGQGMAPSADSEVSKDLDGVYNLDVGTFDVTVSVGPDTPGRRQEAVQAMTAFIQSFPAAAPVIGDVLAENMDWPGANIVAERLRKLVPPQVLNDQNQEVPPHVQAQMQQMQQMMQMMQQELEESKRIIDGQVVQMQSRERIAAMQEQSKMALAAMELKSEEGLALAASHMKQMELASKAQEADRKAKLEIMKGAADAATRAAEAAHDRTERDKDRQHERELSAADRASDTSVASADRVADLTKNRADNQTKLTIAASQAATARATAVAKAREKKSPEKKSPGKKS